MQLALLLTSSTARLCLGCARNPEAECKKDQAQLMSVMAQDKQVDHLLQKVDSTATSGKGQQAADLITTEVKPANDRALDMARRVKSSTVWGARNQASLEKLLERRRESIFAYELALRSDDLNRVVGAMKSQSDLEKMALGIESEIGRTPPIDSGECSAKH
jgi:cell division septum initiation protein DivIVA